MRTVGQVIEWLRRRPHEPFWFSSCGSDLLIGVQSDDGSVSAYRCTIVDSGLIFVNRRKNRKPKRASRGGSGRGRHGS